MIILNLEFTSFFRSKFGFLKYLWDGFATNKLKDFVNVLKSKCCCPYWQAGGEGKNESMLFILHTWHYYWNTSSTHK